MSIKRTSKSPYGKSVAQNQRKRNQKFTTSVGEKLGSFAILAFWGTDLYETQAQFDEVNQKGYQPVTHKEALDNLFLVGEISRDIQKWLLAIDQTDSLHIAESHAGWIPAIEIIPNEVVDSSEFSVESSTYQVEVSALGYHTITPSDLYVSSLMEPTLASSEVKLPQPENTADHSTENQLSEFDLVDEAEYEETQERVTIEEIDKNQVSYGGFAISNVPLGASGGAGGIFASASAVSGRVIDGYVSGATVFSDLNSNALLDWVDSNQDGKWSVGEGEVWSLTDATGQYVFNAQGLASGPIVSLGGIDVTTGAAISLLKAVAGSSIVTPVSTVFAFAEAQSPGSGKDFLKALGLSSEDLLYDPTLGTSANAATVLKSGASLLVMVNNATAVATAASGTNESTAAIRVFSEISKLSANQFGGLIGSDAVLAQAQLTSVMTSAVTALGADPTSIASTIETASKATAAITSAIVNLSPDAVRSGELLQYAQAGQQSLVAEMKTLAVSAAAGEDVTSLLTKWSGNNAAASILELKSRAAAKLAFNAQDPNNPITTIADVFRISAPRITEGTLSPHTEKLSPLHNDLLKGSGELNLIAVGLLDTKAFVGNKLRVISDKSLDLGVSAKEGVDYTNMSLTLSTGSGSQSYRITHYDVVKKLAQIAPGLDPQFLPGRRDEEVVFDYLVSKSLPPNLKLNVDGNQLVVSNAFDQGYQFGSYDLIYVAQDEKSGASKMGLITLNIEPSAPIISPANNQSLTVSEANDLPASNTTSVLTIAGVQKTFTKVPIPIEVTGISPDGAFIVKGLPENSVLTVKVAGVVKQIVMTGTERVPLWSIRGGDAFTADLKTLEVYVPSNYAGSFKPEFQATARYAGLATTTTASMAINISPTVDGLNILDAQRPAIATFVSSIAPTSVAEDSLSFGLNNQTTALHTLLDILSQRLLDAGSEKLAVRLSLPQNFQLVSHAEFANLKVVSNGQPLVIDVFDTATNSIHSTLSSLKFASAEHLSGEDFSIQLTVGAYEVISANELPKSNDINWLVEPFQMQFSIAPIADKLNFSTFISSQIKQALASVLAANAIEDQPHHFESEKLKAFLTQVNKGIVDNDGSEKLLVKISVPVGFGLVVGNVSQVSREIYADNLDNLVSNLSALSIVSPSDFSGNVEVSFAFASVEINRNGISQAQSVFSDPFVDTWHISAQSDVPTIDSNLITSAVDAGTWSQENHRLPDGRYQVNVQLKPKSTDSDGSEVVYTDIQHSGLLYANATLDLSGQASSITVTQADVQGVSLIFSSKLQGANAPELTKSGTGFVFLESVSTQPTDSKTFFVTFQNLAAGKNITLGGCTFVAETSGASANEVAHFFAKQKLGAWSISDVQTIWDRLPGDLESVTVVYAASTAKPATITLRSVSVDGASPEAYSNNALLSVPFVEKPVAPTLTLMTGINASEDVGIALNELIKVESGVGRTIDNVRIFIDLPDTFKLINASNLVLTKNSVNPPDFYEIGANDLSKIRVSSEPNYVGDLKVLAFARDVATSTSSYKDSATAERVVKIQAVADGFGDHSLFTEQGIGSATNPLALKIGAATTIYDPRTENNLFSGVMSVSGRIDSQETVGVRLVFKLVDADAVSMTCGDKFVIPTVRSTAQGKDLVFSLTQAQITAAKDTITLLAREGVFGKQISLEAYTLHGEMQSTISTQTVASQTIIDALSPNVSIGSVVGLEDSEISIPVQVPVAVDRSAFERMGVKFTINLDNSSNTNSSTTNLQQELQKGFFKIKGGVVEFKYDDKESCWTVFQPLDKPQLDLSNIVFIPPPNYSGSIGMTGTPFSITISSQVPVLGNSSVFKVYVDAVAEQVSLVASVKEIIGAEDRLIPIDFSQYVNTASLSDINESISVDVQISSQLSIVKAGNSLVPVSVSNGVSRYVLSTTVSNFKEYFLGSEGQSLFSLKPATNFSSEGSGTLAGADLIKLSVSTREINGNVSKAANLTIPLKVSAISDEPPEITMLKSTVVIAESQAIPSASNWMKLSEVLSLNNAKPADPSENLSVVVTASSKLELSVGQKSAALKPVSQIDGILNYVVSLDDYEQLYAKGKSFEAGESMLSVRLRSTDFEGTKAVDYEDGNAKTVTVSVNSVASGFSAEPIFRDQVNTVEDGQGVLLSEFISNAAIAQDSSESIFYRLTLPANVKLTATSGVPLLNAKLVSNQLTYEVPSDLMDKYLVTPVANFSGNLEVNLTAFAKESDGSMTTSSTKVVNYLVAPVSDAPTLLVPSSVSGLISVANPQLASPIYVRETDASESVDVDIYLHDVNSADSLVFTLSDGTTLTPTRLNANSTAEWVVHIAQDKVALLQSLKVSSSLDYRGTKAIDVSVVARSQDGVALPEKVTNHFSLSIYQPLPVLTLEVDEGVHAQTIGSLAINLEMPSGLPVGIGASNISVMLLGAPKGAAFYTLDPVSQNPIPIGASLGSGQGGTEPVIWIFKGSDLVDEVNGSWVNRKILVSNDEFLISQVTLQAFITDPVSGAKSQSPKANATLEFSDSGKDWNQSTDPLVLSLDGTAIASIEPSFDLAFELNPLSDGVEYPMSWVSGSLSAEGPSGYAFLVRPADTHISDTGALTLDDLYATFADLVGTSSGDFSTSLTAENLEGVRLWFDANTDGLFEISESAILTTLFPDIQVHLPQYVARPSTSGSIVSLYEADVDLGTAQNASLFAVAIPYRPSAALLTAAPSNVSGGFVNNPYAMLQFLGEQGVSSVHIPEDLYGGPQFVVNLTKAKTANAEDEPFHLIKVFGLPDGPDDRLSLSQGVYVKPSSGESFWILTEDALASPVRVIGLSENFVGEISLTVEAYASLVTGQGETARNWSVKQSVALSSSTLSIDEVADTPELEALNSAVILNEGGRLSFKDHSLLTLSTPDTSGNEDLFVRFHLGADPSKYEVKLNSSDLVPLIDAKNNIFYEVNYADLENVYIQFSPFYAQSTDLQMWGISRQGNSFSKSLDQNNVHVNFTPVADGVSKLTDALVDAQGVTVTDEISEGDTLNVHVQATPKDPNELIQFALVMEGNAQALNAVQATSGMQELSWETEEAFNDYLLTQWQIVDAGLSQRVFILEGIGSNTDPNHFLETFSFKLDPYRNDTLQIRTAALSIDPVHGVASQFASAISQVHTIETTPVINDLGISGLLRDVESGTVLTQLSLKEGGESGWFVVEATSTDVGEVLTATLNNPNLFGLETKEIDGVNQYRLVSRSLPNVDIASSVEGSTDLSLTVSLHVAEGPKELTVPILLNIPVDFVKAVSTPELDLSGRELSVDGSMRISIDDQSATGLLNGVIPNVTSESLSDDVTTYVLSNVPEWLIPSAGKLVSKDVDTNHSTYYFENNEIAGLTWTITKSRITTGDVTDMQIVALNTESTTLEHAYSDPLKISLLRQPIAEKPYVLGPNEFTVAEGGEPTSLSIFSIGLVGFTEDEILQTVEVGVTLNSGLSLFLADNPEPIASGPATKWLSLGDFYAASVSTTNSNDIGDFNLSIVAKQTVGASIAPSDEFSATMSVTNIPENVELSLLDELGNTPQTIVEGGKWKLPKISVTEKAPGETTVITMTVNSQFEILHELSVNVWIPLIPVSIENNKKTFEINPQDLVNGALKISAPDRAQLGTFEVQIKAQSIDLVTGLVGESYEISPIDLEVQPNPDRPFIETISDYVISEDAGQLAAPAVLSVSSPDNREDVELQVVLEGPDGRVLSTEDGFAIFVNGVSADELIMISAQDPLSLLTVLVPKNFYNVSKDGEILSPYSVHISARSIFSVDERSFYSERVDSRFALKVLGVNDAPQLSVVGNLPMQLNEGESSQSVTGVFKFSDVELYDVIEPTVYLASAAYQDASGHALLFQKQNIDDFLHVLSQKNTGNTNTGDLLLTVNPSSAALNFLGAGESISMRWGLKIDDANGGADTEFIDTIVRGTNDSPTSIDLVEGLILNEPSVGSASNLRLDGSFDFDDLDSNDVHTIEVISPEGSVGTFLAQKMVDSQGDLVGKLNWTYTVTPQEINYLAINQLLEQTYKVRVLDANQAASETLVKVQIQGTGDVPTVNAQVLGVTQRELEATTNSSFVHISQGEVSFGDVDLRDTHVVNQGSAPAFYINGFLLDLNAPLDSEKLSSVQMLVESSVFEVSVAKDSTNSGVGALQWNYALSDGSLDFLSKDEILEIVYPLTIKGNEDALTQNFQLTLRLVGENDAPRFESSEIVHLSPIQEENTFPTEEELSQSVVLNFLDVDLSDEFSVDVKPVDRSDSVGVITLEPVQHSGTEGRLGLAYQVNAKDVEYLSLGQVLSEDFLVTLTDQAGKATQQVIVASVVGSNDAPVWLEPISELVNLRESEDDSTVQAVIKRQFQDVDLNDTDHKLKINFIGAQGDLAGGTLTESDFQRMISDFNVQRSSGVSIGEASIDFLFKSTDFDYLSQGESVDLLYGIEVSDKHLAKSGFQDVLIHIAGSNDRPTVIESETQSSGKISEADNTISDTYEAHGKILLQDVDISDKLAFVSVEDILSPMGTVIVSNLENTQETNLSRTFNWSYQLSSDSIQFLAQDEKITDSFILIFSDGHGGQVRQSINIELTGTNDSPYVLVEESLTQAAIAELLDQSPGEASVFHQSEGRVLFKDIDSIDTHNLLYEAIESNYVGQFSALISSDTQWNQYGEVIWTFDVNDADLDFLAEGEEFVQNYVIKVSDGKGGSVEQTVNVTLTGKDDAPIAKDTYATLTTLEKPFAFQLSDFSKAVTDPDSEINSITIESLPYSSGVGGNGTLGLIVVGLSNDDSLVTDDGKTRYHAVTSGQVIGVDEIDRLIFIPAEDSVAPRFSFSVQAGGVQSNRSEFSIYSSLVLNEDDVRDLTFDDFLHFLDSSVELQGDIRLEVLSSSGGELYAGVNKVQGKTSLEVTRENGVTRFRELVRFVPEANLSGTNASAIQFQVRDSVSGWITGAIVMTVLPILDATLSPVFAAESPVYFQMGDATQSILIDANSVDPDEFYELTVELEQSGIVVSHNLPPLSLNLPGQGFASVDLYPVIDSLTQDPNFSFAKPVNLSLTGSAVDEKLTTQLIATGLTSQVMVLPNLKLLSGQTQESMDYRAQIFGASDTNSSYQPAGNDFSYFNDVMQVDDISFISADYSEIVSTSTLLNQISVSELNMNVYGTFASDIILASENSRHSLINGSGGRDFIYGSAGNETVVLSEGFDAVMTGTGLDTIVLAADIFYEVLSRQEMESLLTLHLSSSDALKATTTLDTLFNGNNQFAGYVSDFDIAKDNLVLTGFERGKFQTTDMDMTSSGGKHLIAVTAQSNENQLSDYVSVLLDVTHSSISFDEFNTEFIHKV